jgi:large subunit ribosomal protein L15
MLNTLYDNAMGTPGKRLGRGNGSGKGKTCGRGTKGQKARSGVAIKGFEGGQMPIYQRLPKRGFKNPFKVYNQVVNVFDIETAINKNKYTGKIDKQVLLDLGLINRIDLPVKILAKGDISVALDLEIELCSSKAEEKIVKAGGKVNRLS